MTARLGLHELAEAIAADRPERASGSFGLHVVDVARGILIRLPRRL